MILDRLVEQPTLKIAGYVQQILCFFRSTYTSRDKRHISSFYRQKETFRQVLCKTENWWAMIILYNHEPTFALLL